ncbi:cobalt ABC transporter permease [Clostridiales bacterium PH28_bin88]|nr:cobalt ABC transporter permease [Clostridiales bacterium PH28_bin88]
MLLIDQYAYANRFLHVHPAEKCFFAVATMTVCLFSRSPVTFLVVTMLMAGVTTMGAGIPGRFYAKLMLVPAAFLVAGVATIAISFDRNPAGFLYAITLGEYTVGVRSRDLVVATNLFFKSLGAVSCLYFLSLTTPMVEIIAVLRRLKVPSIFIELMTLIYRFIFVLMETAERIHISQTSRLGYSSLRNSYVSLSRLFSTLFLRSYHRSHAMFTALLSRCYDGQLNVLESTYTLSKQNLAIIMVAELLLVALAWYTGGGFSWRN